MKPLTLLASLCALAPVSVHAADWQPVPGKMITRWGKSIDPAQTWHAYPRPQMERENWSNLNGLWDHAVLPKDAARPDSWDGPILVPFALESTLSGVGKLLQADQSLWYHRALPAAPAPGQRTLLHFEAVDYQCTLWINDREVGGHTGGNLPFSFDITDALKPADNQLTLRVLDTTGGFQLRGKQTTTPKGIWYTRVSGIWQSVWLEQVPDRHFTDLDFACRIDDGILTVTPTLAGPPIKGEMLRVTVTHDENEVAKAGGSSRVKLTIPEPLLWSPAQPTLYSITAELLDAKGKTVDSVKSYTAFREFGKSRDASGHLRFTLNGKPIFHWGPLDQGWWPDGLLTPPSDEAMLSDIGFLKQAGFNMIRKHIKVEPRRYYYHCDRLGMLMWQDQPSTTHMQPKWTRMDPDPRDGNWPDEAHAQWVAEYRQMVESLRDTVCIASWVPFNEAWGQHRTMEVGKLAAELDPSRAINIASGGNFWPVGDVADHHSYPDPDFPITDQRYEDFIKVVGEFGGHGWPVKDHLWNESNQNWGYGGLPKSIDEWKQRYVKSIDRLCQLRRNGVAAGVYTQTTDVENEINGLLTYDRLQKIDPAWLKQQSARLLATPDAPAN